MGAISESPTFDDQIYLLENNDPVAGGLLGASNKQAKGLANRTRFLKNENEQRKQEIYGINTGGAFVPVGAILFVVGATPPTGYLKMNGATLSRTTYARLWAFAQNNLAPNNDTFNYPGLFGAGDGVNTFQLPDTRGWFPRFWDDGRGNDTAVSRAVGSSQSDRVGYHQHAVNASQIVYANYDLDPNYGMEENDRGGPGWRIYPVTNTTTASDSTLGGWGETRVRNIALLGVIKY